MLRKLLSLTLTIALLATFCTFPVSAATLTKGVHSVNAFSGTVKATPFVADSNVKIVGRHNPENPLLFAWHTSGVEFDVTGTSVVGVRLKDYDTTTRNDMKHDICLNVTINGEAITTDGKSYTEIYDYGEANTNWLANNPQPDKNCFEVQNDGLEHDYIFATNLDPNKTYTVKVTLAHENWGQYQHYAFWAVSALTDNVSSVAINRTADAENKILVLGDSLTSAANIGGIQHSYHQLAAQAFGADTQVVSAGGAIFTNNYLHDDGTGNYVVDANDVVMGNKMGVFDAWDKTAWCARYQFIPKLFDANSDGQLDVYASKEDPNFTPDLIILNIGSNDGGFLNNSTATPAAYSQNGKYSTVGAYNQEVFRRDFTQFLDEVRDIYNNPKIILCYGMAFSYSHVVNLFESVKEEYNAANPTSQLTTFYFDGYDPSTASFLDDGVHPDEYTHKEVSEVLIKEIKRVMGWERVTDDPATARAPQTITLVPNANGDKFTLPATVDKVIVGDTIVIPYGAGGTVVTSSQSKIIKINGVRATLQPLWKATGLLIHGQIGGTTYSATQNGCYITGQGSVTATETPPKRVVNSDTNAKTGWASALKFTVAETGTYKASTADYMIESNSGSGLFDTAKTTSAVEIMEPFTAVEVATVTFVDKSVGTVNHDREMKVDMGSNATSPKKYETGYKFFSDAECTSEINLATEKIYDDTTVYVMDINDLPEGPSDTQTLTADAQGNITLPELTEKEGALLKGWYDENGNVFAAGTKVTANSQITLTPIYMDTKEAMTGKVNPDGVSAEPFSGDSAIASDAEFTNGMYYQGIQIRKTSPTGLRFVFARGFELERLIKGEIPNTSFEVRYLVALKSALNGAELTVDTAALKGVVENIYRTSEELSVDGQEAEDYNKFTVCVTGLNAEAYINTVICVRPYITYTDASGQEHILYGEQASCSLYEGAKGVYDGSTNAADKEWLYENILSLAYGDNDEDSTNIFK